METIVSIIYIFLLLFVIKKWSFFKVNNLKISTISSIFILKIGFGILLFLIYYYYYGNDRFNSDAFKYYDDSLIIFELFKHKPVEFFKLLTSIGYSDTEFAPLLKETSFWFKEHNYGMYNDNRTLIRLNLILRLFSFGYYHVHSIFMCFISLIGLVGIYKAFYIYFRKISNLLFASVFLVPTVLFWGSSVLKEGVLLFAIGILFYSLHKIYFKLQKTQTYFSLAFSLFILSIMKVYIFLSITPLLLFFLITRKNEKYLILKFIGTHLLCIAIAFNLKHVANWMDIPQYLMMKQHDFFNVAETSNAQSVFELARLENNFWSFLSLSPKALFNSFFKPLPWEAHNPLALFNSIENLIIFCVPIAAILYAKSKKIMHKFWVLSLASYTITLYTIIGLSVPVAGAMVRYKLPAIPFVLILFLFLVNQAKIREIKWLKRFLDIKL